MCGRFAATIPPDRLAEVFEASVGPGAEIPARWNVAPTSPVFVVHVREGQRTLALLRWGLVPSWATSDPAAKRLVNARAETIAEKPAFRSSFKARRCIIPMDGFYEWKASGGVGSTSSRSPKEPYFFSRRDKAPLAVAGIWAGDIAATSGGATFAVVTTAANRVVRSIHDRMPAILEPPDWEEWLDLAMTDVGGLLSMLKPADDGVLDSWRVSTAVNSVRNDGPELVSPLPSLF
jgi:putative SOS response-associated peptidase YedK